MWCFQWIPSTISQQRWGDEILYHHRPGYGVEFPIDLNGQMSLRGDSFPGLGQFPVKLTLNPNPNGFVYYDFACADIPETNLNFGSLTSSGNTYHNLFTWNDVITTSAQVFVYADGWAYAGPAAGTPVTLNPDTTPRELNLTEYALDGRGYTMNDTRKLSALVDDGYGNPQNYLTFKDSIVDTTNGKLSIVSQYPKTSADGRHVVRLLMYFDTTEAGRIFTQARMWKCPSSDRTAKAACRRRLRLSRAETAPKAI
jgi:hypothetical protein